MLHISEKEHDSVSIYKLTISIDCVKLFKANSLYDDFLKKLVCILKDKKNPIRFFHYKPRKIKVLFNKDIQVDLEPEDFDIEVIKIIENSVEPARITEDAAIGLLFSFFLSNNELRYLQVYKSRGKGYDYFWEQNTENEISIVSLECTGCNKENKQTFNKRISKKYNKFKKKDWDLYSDKKFVGVVDFYYHRYVIWEVSINA